MNTCLLRTVVFGPMIEKLIFSIYYNIIYWLRAYPNFKAVVIINAPINAAENRTENFAQIPCYFHMVKSKCL